RSKIRSLLAMAVAWRRIYMKSNRTHNLRGATGHESIALGASNPAPCSERHTVTVVAKGYVWREATYASLSIIARTITGTAWNGPRFFGLRSDKGITVSPDAADTSPGAPNGRHL